MIIKMFNNLSDIIGSDKQIPEERYGENIFKYFDKA